MLRRVARVLSKWITVLSLLLCLATAILWVRSYFVSDRVRWTVSNKQIHDLDISRGVFALNPCFLTESRIFFISGTGFSYHQDHPSRYMAAKHPMRPNPVVDFRAAGFGLTVDSGSRIDFYIHWPCWFVCAVTLILPVRWWLTRRRDLTRGFPVLAKKPGPEGANPPAPG